MPSAEAGLQLVPELRAAVLVHVERPVAVAQHPALLLLHREAGVQEQRALPVGPHAVDGEEAGHPAHHGAHGGDAVLRVHLQVHELPGEAGHLALEFRDPLDVRVDRRHAVLQGLHLGVHAHLQRRQPGDAHLHAHELLPGVAFDQVHQALQFPDRGLAHVRQAAGGDPLAHHVRVVGRLPVFHGLSPCLDIPEDCIPARGVKGASQWDRSHFRGRRRVAYSASTRSAMDSSRSQII